MSLQFMYQTTTVSLTPGAGAARRKDPKGEAKKLYRARRPSATHEEFILDTFCP